MADYRDFPNVLLVFCDQLRPHALASYGGPVPTPNLDRVAGEGVRFSQAYCTYPMCTPARAALLTGRFCHALRDQQDYPYLYNNQLLDLDAPTFAKTLTAAGYNCSYIGKWHTDDAKYGKFIPRGPRRQGFDDEFYGLQCFSDITNPWHFSDDGQEKIQGTKSWEPDHQTDLAEDYLRRAAERRQREGTPFCLTISYNPPHGPTDLPSERQHLLQTAREYIKETRPNVPGYNSETASATATNLYEEALESYVRYHANVMGIDECVGRLLSVLEHTELRDNTLVIFTADHGDDLLSHGCTGKNQFYEEAALIPLLINFPGQISEGRETSEFVNIVDLAPTILDFCGVQPDERVQGHSLKPLLTGETEKGPNSSAYLEVDHPWWDYIFGQGPQGTRRCIVTADWKLVLITTGGGGTGGAVPHQLFNRKEDPYETENLVNDPAHYQVISELGRHMLAWMYDTEDPFLWTTLRGRPEDSIEKIGKRLSLSYADE